MRFIIKFYKQLFSIVVAFGFATTASAKIETNNSCIHNTNNSKISFLYGGVMGGYISGNSKVKREMLIGPEAGDKSDVAGNGIIGGIFLGYKIISACKLFIAPEIFITGSNLSGKTESLTDLLPNSVRTRVKSKYSLGASVNLGKKYYISSPFIRLGIVFKKWRSKFRSPLIGNGSRSKLRPGIEIGAGSDFAISKKVCAGFFFAHQHYSSFKYNVITSDNSNIIRVKVRPGANIFMLRLSIKK
jgi:hypothetical protein